MGACELVSSTLGEAGSIEELKVRLFLLSLTGTAFSWFAALPHGSILLWSQLEQKFHDHFYSGDNELKLSILHRLGRHMMKLSPIMSRGLEI